MCPLIISYNSPGHEIATKEGVEITAVIISVTIFAALICYLFFDDKETKKEIDTYNAKQKEGI